MKKKLATLAMAATMALTLIAGNAATAFAEDKETDKSADPGDYKVVMVVKQSDSWFDDMATGDRKSVV